MTDIQDRRLSRRGFLARAAVMATVPTAAAVLGPALLEDGAAAASADTLPSYAPVPPGSFGPALNADGYYVGNMHDNLYWVTDGFYQSMFLAGDARCRRSRRTSDDRSQPAAGDRPGHGPDRHAIESDPPGVLALPRGPHRGILDLR